MCGITAVFNKGGLPSSYLQKSNSIVSYRGPDDEGYLLWSPDRKSQIYAGQDTSLMTRKAYQYSMMPLDQRDWVVGLGHRRLSIIDISPGGHQPMMLASELAISFNGEVYNYIEIRNELEELGHHFQTSSDTEVILHAWAQWGKDALNRFNGMFAFVLLDVKRQRMYAVRDRFGVKPLYYSDRSGYVAFASEVKQLRQLPDYTFRLNNQIAYDYLHYGLIDHEAETFESGIYQLKPGHLLELDTTSGRCKMDAWYKLKPSEWKGDETEACDRFYELLKDSVRLRMRSDVPVGSALSGGLDSSTIVCLMRTVLKEQNYGNHLIKTITACQEDKKYDEWEYAQEVITRMGAESYQVFPSFEKLLHDLDKIIWHMDYPFGSTSQFSQWCVFEEARKQGLTVMIDGQGADEQLAGYGGNDLALYSGLLAKGNLVDWYSEARSYKNEKGKWPLGFLTGSIQINFPWTKRLIPASLKTSRTGLPAWLRHTGFEQMVSKQGSLREHLVEQVNTLPLPALLRYEDRNSMAFSIESRVPFMDFRLIEFSLGLPENLIYRRGERKYILRKAFRGEVPDKILDRKDKMGFVSPEERWMKQDGKDWFEKSIDTSIRQLNGFVDPEESLKFFISIQQGKSKFSFEPWRMLCLGRWLGGAKA